MNAPYSITCEFEALAIRNIRSITQAAAEMLTLRAGHYGIVCTMFDADGYVVPAAEIRAALIEAAAKYF